MRISKQPPGAQGEMITLEGRLVGPWVDELKRVVDEEPDSRRMTVNLRGLIFADARGVSLLRALRAAGLVLVGWSGFVGELIGTEDGNPEMIPKPSRDGLRSAEPSSVHATQQRAQGDKDVG